MISPYVRQSRLGAEIRAKAVRSGKRKRKRKRIGSRAVLYANLEAGARAVGRYGRRFVPGLRRIPEFVRRGRMLMAALEPLAGNAGRERMFRRSGGPTLEVIVDEVAVRRLTAPRAIVQKQLYHPAGAVNGDPRVVFPAEAGMKISRF